MRIMTWNCSGGLQNKMHVLEDQRPDIAVVQECNAFAYDCKIGTPYFTKFATEKRGVSVFFANGFEAEPINVAVDAAYFLPFRVSGALAFNLIAVWAKPHSSGKGYYSPYTVSAKIALNQLRSFILERETIVLGDFNSNAVWNDKATPTHGYVHSHLEDLGLASAYHEFFGEQQGLESRKTFLHRQNKNSYHIDYCYIPRQWLPALQSVSIHPWAGAIQHSDHTPMSVEIDEKLIATHRSQ